jgi:hypothetical protein
MDTIKGVFTGKKAETEDTPESFTLLSKSCVIACHVSSQSSNQQILWFLVFDLI